MDILGQQTFKIVLKKTFSNAVQITDINTEFLCCSFGRALVMLSDYDQAKRQLIAAQRIEPNNISISNELKKVCGQKIILKCSSHE